MLGCDLYIKHGIACSPNPSKSHKKIPTQPYHVEFNDEGKKERAKSRKQTSRAKGEKIIIMRKDLLCMSCSLK